jgi:ankyrin repeat protein
MREIRILQHGCTALHLASRDGHLEVVRYLIEKSGADENIETYVSEFDWTWLSRSLGSNTTFVLVLI